MLSPSTTLRYMYILTTFYLYITIARAYQRIRPFLDKQLADAPAARHHQQQDAGCNSSCCHPARQCQEAGAGALHSHLWCRPRSRRGITLQHVVVWGAATPALFSNRRATKREEGFEKKRTSGSTSFALTRAALVFAAVSNRRCIFANLSTTNFPADLASITALDSCRGPSHGRPQTSGMLTSYVAHSATRFCLAGAAPPI